MKDIKGIVVNRIDMLNKLLVSRLELNTDDLRVLNDINCIEYSITILRGILMEYYDYDMDRYEFDID
jgi:hypothetical protein